MARARPSSVRSKSALTASSDLTASRICSSLRSKPGSAPEKSDRELRLRYRAAAWAAIRRRRAATAVRNRTGARMAASLRRLRRRRPRQSEARRRRDRQSRSRSPPAIRMSSYTMQRPTDPKPAILISTPTNIGDLYVTRRAHRGQMRRLTHINDELFSQLESNRAGNDLVQELRRQAHSGLGAASAGFQDAAKSIR